MAEQNWQTYVGEHLYRGWYVVKNKEGRTCYMMLYSPEHKEFLPLLRGGGWGDPGQPDVRLDELAQYILLERVKYCGPDETRRQEENADWPEPNDFIELTD
jgi:hypothetical protein